jgi:hypothetical protein
MKIYLLAIVLTSYSCQETNQKKERTPTDQAHFDKMVDSMVKDVYKEAAQKGSEKVTKDDPVQVIKAVIVQEEYSNFKSIRLTYKNISDKKIDGIRFQWYGVNTFGEPADMGTSAIEGSGGGFDDDPLGPGKSRSSTWNILSRDAKKVTRAWAYQIAFADGTKWEIPE